MQHVNSCPEIVNWNIKKSMVNQDYVLRTVSTWKLSLLEKSFLTVCVLVRYREGPQVDRATAHLTNFNVIDVNGSRCY